MSTLYIDRQGTVLRTEGGLLLVDTPDNNGCRRLPLKLIERVVLRADTQLNSKVLCALADQGSSLLALGGRGGQQVAQITGIAHGDARRRWQQVLSLSQPQVCAALARAIVLAKVRRQSSTLKHIAQQRPDMRKPLHDGLTTLQGILDRVGDPAVAIGLGPLRGYEGAAAAAYFAAFFSVFAPALGAKHRNRRPPRDPVNAVLSLGYTLLHSQASNACTMAGLDPALGALHTLSHGRAALACDLMEPHRPKLDLWVWNLFRNETLRPDHFGQDGSGACLLGKAGRGHFYQAWETLAPRRARVMLRQARQLARALDDQASPQTWTHLTDDPFAHAQD